MNRTIIVEYMKEKGQFSIPEVQLHFNLDYMEIRDLFSEFEQDGRIIAKNELLFEYKPNVNNGKKMNNSDYISEYSATLEQRRREILRRIEQDDDEEYDTSDDENVDEEDVMESMNAARARLEQRRKEILKRLQLSKFEEKWDNVIRAGLAFWNNEIPIKEALKTVPIGKLGVIGLIKKNRRCGLKMIRKKAQAKLFEEQKDKTYCNMWTEALKLLQDLSDDEFDSIKSMVFE